MSSHNSPYDPVDKGIPGRRTTAPNQPVPGSREQPYPSEDRTGQRDEPGSSRRLRAATSSAILLVSAREGRPARTGELADRLDVNPATVTERLTDFHERDLVSYERYQGATLTDDGESAARELMWKRCLVENFADVRPGTRRRRQRDHRPDAVRGRRASTQTPHRPSLHGGMFGAGRRLRGVLSRLPGLAGSRAVPTTGSVSGTVPTSSGSSPDRSGRSDYHE
ncbi:MAG: metal-dependent transcriptional regulator [Gammaproteobacteria bacterium]|nr:metal-dependent transcriptional regulator [Gammaproteobacteria bacterium]